MDSLVCIVVWILVAFVTLKICGTSKHATKTVDWEPPKERLYGKEWRQAEIKRLEKLVYGDDD